MRMLKTQLVHDLVFIVEPTIRTKVAWARPERAGRKANSKSTCEVQDLRTANALRKRQPSVPFSASGMWCVLISPSKHRIDHHIYEKSHFVHGLFGNKLGAPAP